ncbi:XRE family transcriptional regulator [Streptomyces sp. NPDC002454]|uniref:XRE family transcriptional regulator n=1 Tax=Streptomyces sp. NPDC002490 TaxID=3154416 RepID=UPI0033192A82
MPRWKDLPEELDPQVKEFTGQLRRLVDRSGLGIAALADRTGYSKTSWERYLNGRLLAPKGAIVALAEVTGTNPVHLTTLWELAERAWSRSEMRHDMTMEAIRISQARAALGETGGPEAGGRAAARKAAGSRPGPTAPPGRPGGAPAGRGGAHAARGPQHSTPPGGTPGADVTFQSVRYQGPLGGAVPNGPAARRPAHAAPPGTPPPGRPAGGPPPGPGRPGGPAAGKRRATLFAAGAVGAVLLIAGAFHLTGGFGAGEEAEAKPTPSAPASKKPLPAGVECSGTDCTGKDPETMGCGGEYARTATTVRVGAATVEVRYSKTCEAAWARITQASGGDTLEIAAPGAKKQTGEVGAAPDSDAYTPMVAVKTADEAEACAVVAATKGCTE